MKSRLNEILVKNILFKGLIALYWYLFVRSMFLIKRDMIE